MSSNLLDKAEEDRMNKRLVLLIVHMSCRCYFGAVVLIALALIIFPITAGATTISKRYLYDPNDPKIDPQSITGYTFSMVDFAQTSDGHIIDEGNPIRAEELKLLVHKDPVRFLELGKLLGSILPPAHREVGVYTALIWESIIHSINDEYFSKPFDFTITTGDNTDTGIKDELLWFVALADGRTPADFKAGHANSQGQRTIISENPEGLLMSWYATIGNHDIEYQGTFNSDGFVGLLVKGLAYDPDPARYYINNLSYLDDVISIYQASPPGHGFTDMQTEGYYSFDPTPYVHCLVLNTADYYCEQFNFPLETLSQGLLSVSQYDWMKSEIMQNKDKLCVVFAHHSPNSFFSVKDDNQNYISTEKLKDTLKGFENVVAFVDGHTHENRIVAETTNDGKGYWDINTCAVVDYPQEWRRITIRDNGDGTGTISCRMHDHATLYGTLEPYIGIDILDVSLTENDIQAWGEQGDRDVELYFKMPASVQPTIMANYHPPVTPEEGNDTHATSSPQATGSGGGSSGCFIGTAMR